MTHWGIAASPSAGLTLPSVPLTPQHPTAGAWRGSAPGPRPLHWASSAGARGLLQLTIDAAQKYASNAGVTGLQESQLYQPETSIRIGSEYLRELSEMFPNLPEAVAASYNGGEDNVVRWVKRAKHKDPGVFTSEVGFDETKAYVQKVLNNYRVYRQLYTPDLRRK